MAKPSRDRQSPSSRSLVERGSSSGSRVKTGSSSRSLHNTGSSSSLSKVYTGSDSRSSSSLVPSIYSPLQKEKMKRKEERESSPNSFVLRINNLDSTVDEGQLKKIFSVFGKVVNVELPMDHSNNLPKGYGYVEFKAEEDAKMAKLYLHGNKINENAIKVKFSFVSLPLKAITTLSKIDAPKTNISDGEKDRLKRQREASPCRKPLASPRRGSPVQRDGSPRRPPDSPLRRRADSPVHRRVKSPYQCDDTHPRRRSTSSGRGPSPLMRNRSPSRLMTC
ncbi:serine/arginine-rich splicing factor SR45-like isoform X1 [Alnus glutinosa]|uniref:serine/arginine-rich splicing factor SR45-like isoform X1 n=1 Tax=Alnus glutinosa TaxID=3517 RepID=UPI002D7881ED|nr:serine/arginine-rich splicing factor SR45-like isoform X1 [Alnus glutinosa]